MQRSAKYQSRAMTPGVNETQLLDFFRACQTLLEGADAEGAFYFEQIKDHLRSGKPLPSQKAEISRMLGL